MTQTKHAIRHIWLFRILFTALVFCLLMYGIEVAAVTAQAALHESVYGAVHDTGLTGMARKFEETGILLEDLK
jgi:hypothetical protein